MNALELVATNLQRKDETPNRELAAEIIASKRKDWVKELVENLGHSDKNIQSDCIKVLYEIGLQGAPELIAPYYKIFGKLLGAKNNRLVWGAMIALDTITPLIPENIYEILPEIISAVDRGSVITIDGGVGVLSKLAAAERFSDQAFPLLMEQLKKCPSKQLPMYAEKAMTAIHPGNRKAFLDLLEDRFSELEKDSQKSRLKKVIRKVTAG